MTDQQDEKLTMNQALDQLMQGQTVDANQLPPPSPPRKRSRSQRDPADEFTRKLFDDMRPDHSNGGIQWHR